ncbi:hypothetical protein ACEI25_003429 [Photobacterium damselae]
MKLRGLMVENKTFINEMMKIIPEMKNNHRAAFFLAKSYCNYYRGDESYIVDLSQIDLVDDEYKELFFQMMLIRHHGCRNDNDLFELEQFCKYHLDINNI